MPATDPAPPHAGIQAATAAPFRVTVGPAVDLERLGRDWRRLQDQADHSFFQSWYWIRCLLETTPADPLVVAVWRGDQIVGLAIAFEHDSGGGAVHLCLNHTGEAEYDRIYPEYNGFLCLRGLQDQVVEAAFQALHRHGLGPRRSVATIAMAGVAPSMVGGAVAAGWKVGVTDHKPHHHVDLTGLRAGGRVYLESLGRNTRHQIRRSLKHYGETSGPLCVEAAQDLAQAIGFLHDLRELHQKHWRRRGYPGAFAAPYFEAFHENLIRQCFDDGVIEIIRVSAGNTDIGFLYHFNYLKTILYYQSGFAYDDDPRIKPGLTCHYLCVNRYLERDANLYDFMAGDQRYKSNLGQSGGELVWLLLNRSQWKYRLTSAWRRAKRVPAQPL